jgi:hypothetical protein
MDYLSLDKRLRAKQGRVKIMARITAVKGAARMHRYGV